MAAPPDVRPAGAVVCLHGRGDDENYALDTIHLHDVLAAQGFPWAVAATTGGPATYWHRRADGTDAAALVVSEFVPFVRERLAVERIALLGWSMGGFGALLAAERHPDLFTAVAAASPALWMRASQTAPGAFDDAKDYAANDVFARSDGLVAGRVRVDCGLGDPFLRATREFVRRSGVTAAFGDGYHDAAYWRSVAPAQVRFIAER